MKLLLAFTLPVLLGMAVGYGMARWELGPAETLVLPPVAGSKNASAIAGSSDHPKLAVQTTHFDFGTLEPGVRQQHAFQIRNEGTAPLILTVGEVSCKCTIGKLDKELVQPGEETTVTLEWSSESNGQFRQHAVIRSNDLSYPNVTFEITGRIVPIANVFPEQIQWDRISSKETKSVELWVSAFQGEPLKIEGYEWLDPASAPWFEVTDGELSKENLEITGGKSGRQVTVTLKPGLPRGRIQQRIRLKTNIPERPTLEVPIDAIVEGDVNVVGPKWNPEKNAVSFGSVNRLEGAETKLLLVARGPLKAQTTFKLKSVTPDNLQVSLGTPDDSASSGLRQVPLLVKIPAGMPVGNYVGKPFGEPGEIVIETNHPEVPELRIQVRYAIEGP